MTKQSTPPFTKDAMASELKEILLIQGSQIAHAARDEAALAFLGFAVEFSPGRTLDAGDAKRIDLERFAAWSIMSAAYDYAFQVGRSWGYGESDHHAVLAFCGGVTPEASSGEVSPFQAPDSKCRHTADLAIGRYLLEAGYGGKLSVRHLALLADMSEAAVRNSLSAEKIRAPVEASTALKWLQGRKGFVRTRIEDNRQAFWAAHTRSLLQASRFGEGLRTILTDLRLAPEQVAKNAGVPTDMVAGLMRDAKVELQVELLVKLAVALEVDVPHFVGQATEAILRARS